MEKGHLLTAGDGLTSTFYGGPIGQGAEEGGYV